MSHKVPITPTPTYSPNYYRNREDDVYRDEDAPLAQGFSLKEPKEPKESKELKQKVLVMDSEEVNRDESVETLLAVISKK